MAEVAQPTVVTTMTLYKAQLFVVVVAKFSRATGCIITETFRPHSQTISEHSMMTEITVSKRPNLRMVDNGDHSQTDPSQL